MPKRKKKPMLDVQEDFKTAGDTVLAGLRNSVVNRVSIERGLTRRIVWVALGPYNMGSVGVPFYWHMRAELRFLLGKSVVAKLPFYVGNFVNYPNDELHSYQFRGSGVAPSMFFHTDKNSNNVIQEHEASAFPVEVEADTAELYLQDVDTDLTFIGITGMRIHSMPS